MATKHEHRPATYRSGGERVVRCSGCFEVLKDVDDDTAPPAPAPEPVEITDRDLPPAAPTPEPVDGPEDHVRKR